MIDTDGKKIWSGTLNASPELSVDVTTAFAKPADDQTAATSDDEESGDTAATQWFIVSDLGLTSLLA